MSLYKFNSHPQPGFHDKDGKLVTADNQVSLGAVRSNKVTGNAGFGNAGGGGGMGMDMGLMGGGSNNIADLYNPVRDRLDEGSIIEDWIPRDLSGLNEMFKLMYHRDPIAGTIVDLLAELIWSDFDLTGISDPTIKKVYLDCLSEIDILDTMPAITREYLVLGRNVSSLMYDKSKGIFSDIVSHDTSFTRLTPIPIKGHDPKIDILPSPGLRAFMASNDIRDVEARANLPQDYIRALMGDVGSQSGYMGNQSYPSSGYPSGGGSNYGGGFGIPSTGGNSSGVQSGIPLDPLTTAFTARRVFNYDYIGTSLYTRIINFWALEKALLNATMSHARRRVAPIMHIKMGIDNVWEPTPDEISNVAGMFIQADQDPVGAMVATRTGIDVSEVRSGTDFYKWSDEWTLLTEGKMRALGANDALLSGDATYSNQETARMFFMERAEALRAQITNDLFVKKLFPLIARIHGFTKRSNAELNHRIRVNRTQNDFNSVSENDLIIPDFKWHKELNNHIDQNKLDVYDLLEEKGVPITLENWAAAGGVKLEDQLADMDIDSEYRQRVAEYKSTFDLDIDVEEAKAKAGFVRELQELSKENTRRALGAISQDLGPLNSYIFWDESGNFGPLNIKDMADYTKTIDASSNRVRVLADPNSLSYDLMKHFKDPRKAIAAHYLMYRTQLTRVKPELNGQIRTMLVDAIEKGVDRMAKHGRASYVVKLAQKESKYVHSMSSENKQAALDKLDKVANGVYKSKDRMTGSQLYSGRRKK